MLTFGVGTSGNSPRRPLLSALGITAALLLVAKVATGPPALKAGELGYVHGNLGPTVLLRDGTFMPVTNFGVWSPQLDLPAIIRAGARGFLVDIGSGGPACGKALGSAINAAIASGNYTREDFYVTVVAECYHDVLLYMQTSGLAPYVDLVLFAYGCGGAGSEVETTGSFNDRKVNLKRWRQLEALVHAGFVRTLGVAHFDILFLRYILADAIGLDVVAGAVRTNTTETRNAVRPSVSAMSGSIGIADMHREYVEANFDPRLDCHLLVMGPLDQYRSLYVPEVRAIAAAHAVDPSQVALRYWVQQPSYSFGRLGLPVLTYVEPGPHGMRQVGLDLDLFGFNLTQREFDELARLDFNPPHHDGFGEHGGSLGVCVNLAKEQATLNMPIVNFGVGSFGKAELGLDDVVRRGGRGFSVMLHDGEDPAHRASRAIEYAVGSGNFTRDDFFVTVTAFCWEEVFLYEQNKFHFVDLVVLHAPCETMHQTLAKWTALEKLVKGGYVGALGVANFGIDELRELYSKVRPRLLAIRLFSACPPAPPAPPRPRSSPPSSPPLRPFI
jgi:diketogulonate reductase-like aldo/keto reductase